MDRLAAPATVTDVAVDANERPARPERDLGRAYVARTGPTHPRAPRRGARSRPADMAAIHGDTRLGSAEELLVWVRRAGELSPAAAALRDRARVGPAHDRRQHRRGRTPPGGPWSPGCSPRTRRSRRCTRRTAAACCSTPGWASDRGWPTRCRGCWAPTALGIDGAAVAREALERAAAPPERAAVGRPPPPPARPDPARLPRPGVEPVPLSGDTDCVRCTASVPGVSDRSWRGSVARWVWDLGDRRRSRWGVPFGASGDPASPHATDQLATWAAAETVEVVTDWDLLGEEAP